MPRCIEKQKPCPDDLGMAITNITKNSTNVQNHRHGLTIDKLYDTTLQPSFMSIRL